MKYLNQTTARMGVLALLLTFCTSPKNSESATTEEPKSDVAEQEGLITLTKAPDSPAYLDAELKLEKLFVNKMDTSARIEVDFIVENYELGIQTEGADTLGIANSDKGQHIHFIVNNGPYSAHYEESISKELPWGNYVLLAFLSRSYHESVKNPKAFFIQYLPVGNVEKELVDLTTPHLFYSRPKGTYKGEDTKKLLLDFYVLNTKISADSNKVRATINEQEFMIDEWVPFYIENAPLGVLSIKLELVDNKGTLIPGPFNSVERKVMLEE